jgi:membrane fusion protein, heavy metal efflux system
MKRPFSTKSEFRIPQSSLSYVMAMPGMETCPEIKIRSEVPYGRQPAIVRARPDKIRLEIPFRYSIFEVRILNLIRSTTALMLLASLPLLLAGCGQSSEVEGHAGHGHGETKAHVETKGGGAMCAEHGVPETQCAVCKPDRTASLKPGESMKVRLPSTNSTAIVGVETALPETGGIADSVECVAEISFNQNKLAEIAAPVSGIVQAVDADLGSKVEENQTVAKIWSASIAEAVAKAVLSHQTLDRERKLRADRVTSQAALEEAEAAHRAACQPLRTLGFTEQQIDELTGKPHEQVLMEVRAPFAGEIAERMAVRGALVDVGKPLFTLVDHSTVWAMLQVPEAALARVKVDQTVELRVDSLPGRVFRGKLTWLGPAVDERTRMALARAEFANPDGLLKDNMFATARILTRQAEGALLVPAAAVQYLGDKPFVFVKLDADLFDARAVTLGASFDGQWEVLAGLKPQEQIAVNRTFALKSAMLMSRLGAGCADD